MKKLLFLLIIAANLISAQSIGEIFKNEDVPSLFGKKLSEVKIEAEVIRKAIPKAGQYIMFRIQDGEVIIADVYSNILNETKTEFVDPEWQFKLFTTDVIENLLDSVREVSEKFVYFEIREKDSVLRYEDNSADRACGCPPHCVKENFASRNLLHIDNFMVFTIKK